MFKKDPGLAPGSAFGMSVVGRLSPVGPAPASRPGLAAAHGPEAAN
jgi:hypothetical protein